MIPKKLHLRRSIFTKPYLCENKLGGYTGRLPLSPWHTGFGCYWNVLTRIIDGLVKSLGDPLSLDGRGLG
jgi:hypothetical protein